MVHISSPGVFGWLARLDGVHEFSGITVGSTSLSLVGLDVSTGLAFLREGLIARFAEGHQADRDFRFGHGGSREDCPRPA